MKVKSESEVTQSCLTLSDPMDYSLPASSVHGIFQARVLEWGAIAFSGSLTYLTLNTPNNTASGILSKKAYHVTVCNLGNHLLFNISFKEKE